MSAGPIVTREKEGGSGAQRRSETDAARGRGRRAAVTETGE